LRPSGADALLRLAGAAFTDAAALAGRLGDSRAASYAWGNLGALYEEERRVDEALDLTRRAIIAAQRAGAPESLYRWQWQSGRLLAQRGGLDEAIAAYRRALQTLQGVRSEVATAYGGRPGDFRESVGPVFLELVDLLLRRTDSLSGGEQAALLREARETVELLKAAELRDYFRDDCVDAARARVAKLEAVSQTAVVVYPILLPTRLELLVSVPSGLRRKTVPVSAAMVTEEVRQFRRKLEKRTTHEYRPHAQQLYAWLIRPIEQELAEASPDTLVFVPDGPLRTIPMAALHDGDQFLAARYALAITPGLSLTDPRPMTRERAKVLAAGVTEAVQGFSALPNVRQELEAIHDLYGSTTLLNRDFRLSDVRRKLKDERFTIVHIASHAQFGSDVDRTFLLAFDDRLTIDGLDEFLGVFKFRDEPLELLTLSACDTAIGDDRAALGLAGVAIKAGARSAVATLWHINDRASTELMTEFYRQLREPSTSRAQALNRAQLKLLNDPRYEHPGYWSPFLLINNWL
jgi:CHAT domain-containing protein